MTSELKNLRFPNHAWRRILHETRTCAAILSTAISLLLIAQTAALDFEPRVVGSWPGFRRNPSLAVTIDGDSAYVLSDSHLHVLNISNRTSPVRIGGYGVSPNLKFPSTHALAISGKHAFLRAEGGLQVIDFTNPAAPQRIATFEHSFPLALAVSGTNAFLLDSTGLHVLDISHPAYPSTIAKYEITAESPVAVAIADGYAVVSSLKETPTQAGLRWRAALRILDLRNTSATQLVGTYQVDGQRDFQASVAVSGKYAYLLVDTLHIIDITDPANAKKIGGYEVLSQSSRFDFRQRALALSSDSARAYLLAPRELNEPSVIIHGDQPHFHRPVESRVEIIDVSNPASPTRAGSFSVTGAHHSIAVCKGVVYLAGATPDVALIDVTNPATPRKLDHAAIGDWALDVAVSGSYAYVAEGDAGLQILDISQPSNPRRIAHYPGRANRILVSGAHAYLLGDDVQILDITEPATPRVAGRYPVDSPRALTVASQHAYLITSPRFTEPNLISSELLILNVGDPGNPQFVGRYISESTLFTVAVSGNYAWLSENGASSVIDISNPRNPRRLNQNITDSGRFTDLFCSGNFLYGVSDGELQIFDIRIPASPARLSVYRPSFGGPFWHPGGPVLGCADVITPEDPVSGLGLVVSTNYAYLASGLGLCFLEGTEFDIVDIRDPAKPRRLGNLQRYFDTPNPFWRERRSQMALSGNHIFMADRNEGLQIVNVAAVANPQAPRFQQIVREPAGAVRFRISGSPGVPGRLQRSTDLKTWTDWLPVKFGANSVEISDPDGLARGRFYRIVAP